MIMVSIERYGFVQSLDILDDNSLLEVLSQLSLLEKIRLRAVSKRWERLLNHELRKQKRIIFCSYGKLWVNRYKKCFTESDMNDSISQDYFSILNNNETIQKLAETCPNVKSIAAVEFSVFPQLLHNLAKHFDIVDLTIARCFSVNSDELKQFVLLLPRLKSITLIRCMFESHLNTVVVNCPQLTKLDIHDNVFVTGVSLRQLGSNIHTLDVSEIIHLNTSGLLEWLNSDKSNNLKHLRINCSSLNEELFSRICKLSQLEFLSLPGCCMLRIQYPGQWTAHLIGHWQNTLHINWSLISRLKRLEALRIDLPSIYGQIDDRTLLLIMKNCNSLKKMSLHFLPDRCLVADCTLTDKSIGIINELCPNIEYLWLCNAVLLTDKSMASISKLTKLKQLTIQHTKILIQPRPLSLITDAGITEIIRKCKLLESLMLFNINSITVETIGVCVDCAKSRKSTLRVEIEGGNFDSDEIIKYLKPHPEDFPRNLTLLLH